MPIIDVRFLGGLNAAQQGAFSVAAARWQEVLPAPLPAIRVDGEVTNGIIIEAEGVNIDGRGSVLGSAGPTVLRPNLLLPAKGIMRFDTADIRQLENEGTFRSVILHEMGHVIGLGTLWEQLGLLRGAGTDNPTFTGSAARAEYRELLGAARPLPVPVANTGGPGTREGHWRESVFGNELMTGFLSGERQPLSRLTLASFSDLGYEVNLAAADPYRLGEASDSIQALPLCKRDMMRPTPVVLPEIALV